MRTKRHRDDALRERVVLKILAPVYLTKSVNNSKEEREP